MDRPSYLVLPFDSREGADYLTSMLENGWRLVSIYEGKCYFENLEMLMDAYTNVMKIDIDNNGPVRNILETMLGVQRAKREPQ